MRKVAIAARPLVTAKAICKDYASLHHNVEIDDQLEASDVQALRVQVQRRQGGIIYPEQEPRFRNLDRLALQGKLTAAALGEAAGIFHLFRNRDPWMAIGPKPNSSPRSHYRVRVDREQQSGHPPPGLIGTREQVAVILKRGLEVPKKAESTEAWLQSLAAGGDGSLAQN